METKDSALSKSIDTLEQVLVDENATNAEKLRAAEAVLHLTLLSPSEILERCAQELTDGETVALISRLRGRLAETGNGPRLASVTEGQT